jgi:transposase
MPNSKMFDQRSGSARAIVKMPPILTAEDVVKWIVRHAGARLLFRPKYSPDLNPIEQLFATLKRHLRQAQARSQDAVFHAIAKVLETVAALECSNYFAHAGYQAT